MSKSTVSRVTQQLNQDVETWRHRDLSDRPVVYVFLDGQYHAARQGTVEKEGVLSPYARLEDGFASSHSSGQKLRRRRKKRSRGVTWRIPTPSGVYR